MSAQAPTSRVVIQCNLIDTDGQAPRGYLANANWGNYADKIEVVLRRKEGRWSAYWTGIERFDNFRVKTLPPEHPRFGDGRILDFPDRPAAEEEVAKLVKARAYNVQLRNERRPLWKALGCEPPAAVRALPDEQQADLAAAVEDARARQRHDLRAAIDGAYAHVPRLLRGPLRKVMGG